MRPIHHLAMALLAACATPAGAQGPAARGLCSADETTHFACRAPRGRSIALCGVPGKTLQYRFGRVGAVELRYPESATHGLDSLFIAHYSRYQTNRFEIRFENQRSEYVVFDYAEDGRREAGVRVTTPDSKERVIACTGRPTSRLGDLEASLKCDTDNALNTSGNCR